MIDYRDIRHFHLFCGLGGGAKGFNKARPRVGNMEARFNCLGGIDVDPSAIKDFERLTGTKGTVLDLFDRSQYVAFHGKEPPAGWREATPADIRNAAGNQRPHIVFTSAPCKGFSGLLSESRSKTDKYQALNRLTLRGIWLMLEAWSDDPPELVVFENVPRIANRGRHLLDQINNLLQSYGYAVAETTHDCGELGGLAQSRKRFLLVARHIEKVPPFLYEPPKRRLAAVGDVLGRMPLPGAALAGPMHRVPSLQWKTWVRLAFVEAGSDWRSLNRLTVQDGYLRDFLIVPEAHHGYLGVREWDKPMGTVTSRCGPTNGSFVIADPRYPASEKYGQLGVRHWQESTGTVTGQRSPIQGGFSVADPRMPESSMRQNGIYRVVKWDGHAGSVTGAAHVAGAAMSVSDPRYNWGENAHSAKLGMVGWQDHAGTITGAQQVASGALSVADPRRAGPTYGKYGVTAWEDAAGTVISGSTTGQGAFAVADPRTGLNRGQGDSYLTAGHYGVIGWNQTAGAVSAAAGHDNGRWSVADPRLPAANDKLVAVIQSMDNTWHRPFTTLELAALQSLIDPEEYLELQGLSDSDWRERIGNAVPPGAAQAIAEVMGTTLLLAWSGETFVLSATPIWVQPVTIALTVAQHSINQEQTA